MRDGGEAAQTTVRMEQSETVASSDGILCGACGVLCAVGQLTFAVSEYIKRAGVSKEIPALILTETKSVNDALFCIFIEDMNSLGIDSNSDCVACASL